MFKRHILARSVQRCMWTSLALTLATPLAMAEETPSQESAEAQETITVTGVRSSLRDAAFMKKSASQILDAISAEDIGQLPDKNIAEALQRVTGIQIGRDETGAGANFQVRGLSQNRVEVDGQTMASTGESRSNSFNAVDSALFKGIEVFKSPTADMIEGAIGATVRLKSFSPLDFKTDKYNFSAEGTKNEIAEDNGGKVSGLISKKLELDTWGEIGALVNVSYQERATESHEYNTNWAPLKLDQYVGSSQYNDTINKTAAVIFRPDNIVLERKPFEEDNLSLATTLQWALNESVQFKFNYQRSDFNRKSMNDSLRLRTNSNNDKFQTHDLATTDFDETPELIQFARGSYEGELYRVKRADGDAVSPISDNEFNYFEQEGTVARYLLQSGGFKPQGFGSPTEIQSGLKEETVIQEVMGLAGTFHLNDNLIMDVEYSYSGADSQSADYTLVSGLDAPTKTGASEVESGVDSQTVSNSIIYANYDPSSELPLFGTESTDPDADTQDALLNIKNYAFKRIWNNESKVKNAQDSLRIDFDWVLDGNYITKLEFGARLANNQVNRQRMDREYADLGTHSIFASKWRCYDRNPETSTELDRCQGDAATADWINRVMAEDPENGIYAQDITIAPGQGYLDPFIEKTPDLFPNAGNSNTPNWYAVRMQRADFDQAIADFFPGRNGDCTLRDVHFTVQSSYCRRPLTDENGDIYDQYINGGEFDAVVTVPKSVLELDEAYPYRITEKTQAIYGKANFEFDFGIPLTGNVGVRIVKTDVESMGIAVERFFNEATGQAVVDFDGEAVEQYNPVTITHSYTNVLPSLNVMGELTDTLFMRFAIAKAMTRAQPWLMGASSNIGRYTQSARIGNPKLNPEEATSLDLSLEWYIDDVNTVSAAYFAKKLDGFMLDKVTTELHWADVDQNGKRDDALTVTRPENGDDGKVYGIELAANHAMEYLPGFLSGFGVQANYTYTNSDQESGLSELTGESMPLKDLSENSYNFVLFYDKYGFNFRAAYNYRDENFEGYSSAGADLSTFEQQSKVDFDGTIKTDLINKGIQIPVWNDEFETLDVSASYRYKQMTLFLQGTNVLGEPSRRYVGDKDGTKNLLRFYRDTGATYTAGIRVSF